ncbi:TIGR01457 family HAD-type hydrolase [Alkalibacillus aidingensis]|uniref:TIGR01457 family HAD-type hydrolase n=1 Tax=Alkalibacillus aidingensis TaxID=2747607 RepID=UPI001660CE79|nr:TIGR01457 family HAD-type hydrolase [Alkalibacillus aidingensis]
MKRYQAYFIDLDGTMYRGNDPIPEAKGFIERLKEKQIPYLFVTNNSSRTPERTVEKLASFGIEAEVGQVLTPSVAAANYINQQKENATAFAIGEIGLTSALEDLGVELTDQDPDYVVVGIDRHNTYDKLKRACLHIQNGATFLATNPDIRVPTEQGLVPGNGAFVNLIADVSKTEPIVVGKPEHHMIQVALRQLDIEPSDAIMVGDNYQTDIQAGIQAGLDTLHVETGVTSKDDLKQYDIQPTYSVTTLAEWTV